MEGGRKSPIQGLRPAPLRVSKESHKIGKPPPPPPPAQPPAQPAAPPRRPVIIYDVSPKVHHIDASDFMAMVQRLTGPSPAAPPQSTGGGGGDVSPAARLAAVEMVTQRAAATAAARTRQPAADDMITQWIGAPPVDCGGAAGGLPGILSPLPSSLPPLSPSIFDPTVDPTSMSFLNEMSPLFRPTHAAANIFGGAASIYGGDGDCAAFLASPGSLLSNPFLLSPQWDFFSPL
ncbi:uncharacterized protein LOC144705758 [Wolffia australiana]